MSSARRKNPASRLEYHRIIIIIRHYRHHLLFLGPVTRGLPSPRKYRRASESGASGLPFESVLASGRFNRSSKLRPIAIAHRSFVTQTREWKSSQCRVSYYHSGCMRPSSWLYDRGATWECTRPSFTRSQFLISNPFRSPLPATFLFFDIVRGMAVSSCAL